MCIYTCAMESLYSSSIFVTFFFFFPFFSIFVQKSIIRHQKNSTTHFSPPQLFNKFDLIRLKFYLSETPIPEPIIFFLRLYFSSILVGKKKKRLTFDQLLYIFVHSFVNNECTWRFHSICFTIDQKLSI